MYEYSDYRTFLMDLFQHEKEADPTFSHRTLSRRAGFKSPNFFKLVTLGQRNLSTDSAKAIAAAFRMNKDESSFLVNLVTFNQSTKSEEKAEHARQLYKSKVFQEIYPLKTAQLNLYSFWYCVPIREMIASPSFRNEPGWIAEKLRGKVSSEQISEAIEILCSLDLVRRDRKGKLSLGETNVTTGNEVQSVAVAMFHKQMIKLASDAIDEVPRLEREISGSTLLLSSEQFLKIKNMIQEFRQSLLSEATADGTDEKAVYQINFQMFPLSQKLGSEST